MPQSIIDIYKEVIQRSKQSELKGKNMLYTSTNGYMYSTLNKGGQMGIRLSKEDRQEFDKKHGAEPFLSYGATMRDYVLIHETLLSDIKLLANWLNKGHDYVSSLPAK